MRLNAGIRCLIKQWLFYQPEVAAKSGNKTQHDLPEIRTVYPETQKKDSRNNQGNR